MADDRAVGHSISLTHEFLALMLGARRASVTNALADFQKRQIVDAKRGTIAIKDRSALEEPPTAATASRKPNIAACSKQRLRAQPRDAEFRRAHPQPRRDTRGCRIAAPIASATSISIIKPAGTEAGYARSKFQPGTLTQIRHGNFRTIIAGPPGCRATGKLAGIAAKTQA